MSVVGAPPLHRASYSSLAGPTSYAPEQLGHFVDVFVQNNKDSFEQGDFATPLLNLLTATTDSELSLNARKAWLENTFVKILDQAKLQEPYNAIARASTRSLIETFFTIATPGHYYHSIAEVRYDTSYKNKINPESVDHAAKYIARFHGRDLTHQNNLAPLLYHAHFHVSEMLFSNRANQIRNTVLGKTLAALYNPAPEPAPLAYPSDAPILSASDPLLENDSRDGAVLTDEWPEIDNATAKACIALAPHFFRVFEAVDKNQVRIQLQPKEKDCCFCIIV